MLKKLSRTEKKSKITEVRQYSLISEIYSDLMKEVNYVRWAKYIYILTKDKIQSNSEILELASGSCNLSTNLQSKYKNIICTDLSKQMLMQSSYKKKIVCNMLHLPFNKQFDLIFSEFDSINYILTQKKMLTFFKEIYRYLKQDGIFTFDVSLEKNSYIHEKDSKKSGKTKNYSYKRKSVFNPKTRIHRNIFEITDKSGNVFSEIHKQKIYDFNNLF